MSTDDLDHSSSAYGILLREESNLILDSFELQLTIVFTKH